MKSKTVRLMAVTAGALLVMTVSTGSTQAHQGFGPGGAFKDAVPSQVEPTPDRVTHLPMRPQMCEEFMGVDAKPFKG
jgi:hypothetical protein